MILVCRIDPVSGAGMRVCGGIGVQGEMVVYGGVKSSKRAKSIYNNCVYIMQMVAFSQHHQAHHHEESKPTAT